MELDNYKLTLPYELVHLNVDITELTTNSLNLSYSNKNKSDILKIDGTLIGYADVLDAGLDINISDGRTYNCSALLSTKESYSLNNLSLGGDEQVFIYNELKDIFKIDVDYDFVSDIDNLNPTFPEIGPSVYQVKTTQAITIS